MLSDQALLDGTHPAALIAKHVHVSHNTGNQEWYTPPDILDRARRVMGAFDCDPASNLVAQACVQAAVYYTKDDSGLDPAKPWGPRVWMNPPYEAALIKAFCAELRRRVESGQVAEAITLTNNGTETSWARDLFAVSARVCFPLRRVRFYDAAGRPGKTPLQGQMLTYIGPRADRFLQEFGDLGHVLTFTRP